MNGLEEAIELFGRVAKAEIAELHEQIDGLRDERTAAERARDIATKESELLRELAAERAEAIERLEKELDEAGARIEELLPSVDEYGTLVRED